VAAEVPFIQLARKTPLAEKAGRRLPLLHRWYSGLVQHLLNLQFRPEGIGVVFAERSDSTDHDNRNCQVE
jgi:hypothetical protein